MDEFTVVGIDPSARKLVAVLMRGDEWEIVKRTMPKDNVVRCTVAYKWVRELVRATPRPCAFFIEKPVFGRGGPSGTLPLAEIHGAMLAAATVAGADLVFPVHNMSWKSKIVGRIPRGSNHKKYVTKHVRMHWFELWLQADGDQDVLDAACIAQYGRAILRMRKLVQHDGVHTVKRPPVRRKKT